MTELELKGKKGSRWWLLLSRRMQRHRAVAPRLRDSERSSLMFSEIISLSIGHVSNFQRAFSSFIAAYPAYASPSLDSLRRTDFSRLDSPAPSSDSQTTYLDYTGAALYPSRLITSFADRLQNNVYGNPHSSNPCSKRSEGGDLEARKAVVSFLDVAEEEEYEVVWTSNATGALRIVGEGFEYEEGMKLVLGVDSHNSVNGMRCFAKTAGAEVVYLSMDEGDYFTAAASLKEGLEAASTSAPTVKSRGLFVLTGQSNLTGIRYPLSLLSQAATLGYTTVLDASALLGSSRISLEHYSSIDAIALSIYKLFGLPTGLGALVIKKSLFLKLKKPWFSGGTVQLAQCPGDAVTLAKGSERFMDGTINFLSILCVPLGFDILQGHMGDIRRRLPCLVHWTIQNMALLKHSSGSPLVAVRSPQPNLDLNTLRDHYGAIVTFEIMDEHGVYVSSEAVEQEAGRKGICFRSGCMCNPGAAAVLMGTEHVMKQVKAGDTSQDMWSLLGPRADGLCRVSFGLASNFKDVWTLLTFLETLLQPGVLRQVVDSHQR